MDFYGEILRREIEKRLQVKSEQIPIERTNVFRYKLSTNNNSMELEIELPSDNENRNLYLSQLNNDRFVNIFANQLKFDYYPKDINLYVNVYFDDKFIGSYMVNDEHIFDKINQNL